MTNLQAALGVAQLENIEQIVRKKGGLEKLIITQDLDMLNLPINLQNIVKIFIGFMQLH